MTSIELMARQLNEGGNKIQTRSQIRKKLREIEIQWVLELLDLAKGKVKVASQIAECDRMLIYQLIIRRGLQKEVREICYRHGTRLNHRGHMRVVK